MYIVYYLIILFVIMMLYGCYESEIKPNFEIFLFSKEFYHRQTIKKLIIMY